MKLLKKLKGHKILLTLLILVIIAIGLFFLKTNNKKEVFNQTAVDEDGFYIENGLGPMPEFIEVETYVSGLELPTAISLADDGRMFIAEKAGRVRIVDQGVLLDEPVIALTDVNAYTDHGLLGITLDPDFSENGYIYLAYTHENTPGQSFSGKKTGRIVRVTFDGVKADESTKVVLIGSVNGNSQYSSCNDLGPATDCIASDSGSHSVGHLEFGPDGFLYAMIGDGASPFYVDEDSFRSQNLDILSGKLLRVDKEGKGLPDNPFYDGNPDSNRSKVYAYGFRNAFRFHFTGEQLIAGDVGWDKFEELNIVKSGGNYAWPCLEGVKKPSFFNCEGELKDPWYVYDHYKDDGGAVVAGIFMGPAFGEYAGSYLFGDYAIDNLMIIKKSEISKKEPKAEVFLKPAERPVFFIENETKDAIYYVAISTGEIKKITYTDGNRRPIAIINKNITSGLAPLSVDFSAEKSTDPDKDKISFLWQIDDFTSTEEKINYVFTENGNHLVKLTVTDDLGLSSVTSTKITTGFQKPSLEIISPKNASAFLPGDKIEIEGLAIDTNTGKDISKKITWETILHHNTHIHGLENFSGAKASFKAVDHGDSDIFVEVKATVTDENGLAMTKSVRVYFDHKKLSQGNLIANPSFEFANEKAEQFPDQWLPAVWGDMEAEFIYPDLATDGEIGAGVIVRGHTSGDAKWIFAPALLEEGKQYLFSVDYQSTVETSLVGEFLNIFGKKQYSQLAVLPPSDNWQNYQFVFTTPKDIHSAIIGQAIYLPGKLITDNYKLTEVEKGDKVFKKNSGVIIMTPEDLILSEPE